MPDGRFLSKSIAWSEQVGSVSFKADYLFMRLIPHLDAAGRCIGAPKAVKAMCCPLRDEMTPATVEAALVELQRAGLLVWYEVGGRQYIEFPGFANHQRGARLDREAPSRIPAAVTPPPCGTVAESTMEPLRNESGVDPEQVRVSEVKRSEVKRSEVLPALDAPRDRRRRVNPDRASSRESWLAPAAAAWERAKGAGTFNWPKAGKLLKPLHEAGHGGDEIGAHLARYLELADPKYVSLPRFAETFGDYAPVVLTGPPVVDGWMSPEVERLTRPVGAGGLG